MGYIVATVINISNLLGTFNKNKPNYFLFFSSLLMWLTFGWNFQNPDYYNYQLMYNDIKNSSGLLFEGKDLGFKLLMNISNLLGMNYQMFVIVVSSIGLLLILSTVRKYSPNVMYVYLLYFIFPFFLDIVQVRNFLMMAIMIFSIRYLVEETRHSTLKFVIANFIAITIHSLAVLYIPLIFVKSKNKMIIRLGVFIILCVSAIIFINGNEIPFIKQIVGLFTNNRFILRWFEFKTNFGFLLPWFIHIMTYFLMLLSKKIIAKNSHDLDIIEVRYFYVMYWITVLGFFFFPFYMVNTEFLRLVRNFSILNYISFSISNKAIGKKNIKLKSEYNFLIIIYTLLILTIQLLVPHYETVIKPILENNLLW